MAFQRMDESNLVGLFYLRDRLLFAHPCCVDTVTLHSIISSPSPGCSCPLAITRLPGDASRLVPRPGISQLPRGARSSRTLWQHDESAAPSCTLTDRHGANQHFQRRRKPSSGILLFLAFGQVRNTPRGETTSHHSPVEFLATGGPCGYYVGKVTRNQFSAFDFEQRRGDTNVLLLAG